MIDQAHNYVRNSLNRNPDTDLSLHFHKPLFTTIKHLHMHVLVGKLNMAGKVFFCNCISNDPKLYTEKYM